MALISEGKTFRLLFGEKVNSKDELKANMELNETPETRDVALSTLKDMLRGVQNLNACMDDDYLLFFLRARKFNCERTFKLLQRFYSYRAQYPELLQTSSQAEPLLRKGVYYHLPYRDTEGRAISVFNVAKLLDVEDGSFDLEHFNSDVDENEFKLERMRLRTFATATAAWDPDLHSFWDVNAAIMLSSETVLWFDPVTQINGIVNICDVQGFSMKCFLDISTPRKLSLFSTLLATSNPARVNTILVVNTPQLVETLWSLIKPLLPKKFGDRVYFFGSDMKELHKFLDPAILPQEYGGKLPSHDSQKFLQIVRDREEYIKYVRQFGFVKTEDEEITEKYTKLNEDDIW